MICGFENIINFRFLLTDVTRFWENWSSGIERFFIFSNISSF